MDARTPESKPERRRFATMPSELRRLSTWLQERGVEEAVMESTAQYWRSVWLELEPHMCLHLAQAFSNRAPRGRKHDFKDAERLVEALTGRSHPMHGQMLALQLERLRLLDEQIAKLNSLIAQAMKPHQDAVIRLAEVPGLGIDSAQQVIAEVGVTASTFPSAAEFTSWVGTCPGKEESAEENSSSRSAKGNKYMRRLLNQAAHAAARSKGTHFQAVFRRLLPRLGYQSAVWAIAHRLCRLVWKILHQGIRYIEQGIESEPKLLIYRAKYLAKQLRKFGYNVQITPAN